MVLGTTGQYRWHVLLRAWLNPASNWKPSAGLRATITTMTSSAYSALAVDIMAVSAPADGAHSGPRNLVRRGQLARGRQIRTACRRRRRQDRDERTGEGGGTTPSHFQHAKEGRHAGCTDAQSQGRTDVDAANRYSISFNVALRAAVRQLRSDRRLRRKSMLSMHSRNSPASWERSIVAALASLA